MALSGSYFGVKTSTLYQILKYSIYVIIFYNVIYFTLEDYNSSAHRFREGVGFRDFYDAFPQAIDSISWFILLLMLELETWIINDEDHKGLVKWSINGVAGICYFFILLAFLGYSQKIFFMMGFEQASFATACDAVGSYLSYLIELDEFAALSAQTCTSVGPAPYYVNEANQIIMTGSLLFDSYLLAFTETTNAATWILVVLVLWIDVYLQFRGELTDRLFRINAYIKIGLYSILIIAAIIWGIYGNFMDFWDAFIWIAAFFFIELNLLQWHEETEAQAHADRENAS